MRRVCLVTTGNYSAYSIDSAFSSEKKAQEYIDSRTWDSYEDPEIECFPIDRWQAVKDRTVWRVTIYDDAIDIHTASRLNGHTTAQALIPDLRSDQDIVLGVNQGENTIWFYTEGPYAGTWGSRWTYGPASNRNPVTQTYWNANVVADDEQHAIKVAAELIAQERSRLAGM